jgi:hypothetical protein
MPNETLKLIPAKPILEERLGSNYFNNLPTTPGIYRFYGQNNELLYVGKAKNLRTRVFSYKRAKSGQVSRKVSRLIGRIVRLEYEETETERDALLLENRWIRDKRPPFNSANKQTEAYYFIYFSPEPGGLEFRLSMRIHDETDPANWYGSFKGHAPVRRSLGCLLQLLWMAEHGRHSPQHLPVQLTRRLTPMHFYMSLPENSPIRSFEMTDAISDWFLGESCRILDFVSVRIEHGTGSLSPFQIRFLEDRLHHLKAFFDRSLTRHKLLRGLQRHIAQDELDDLVVKASF